MLMPCDDGEGLRIEAEGEEFTAHEHGYWGIKLYDCMCWFETMGYRMSVEQSENGAFVFLLNNTAPFPEEEEEQPEEREPQQNGLPADANAEQLIRVAEKQRRPV